MITMKEIIWNWAKLGLGIYILWLVFSLFGLVAGMLASLIAIHISTYK